MFQICLLQHNIQSTKIITNIKKPPTCKYISQMKRRKCPHGRVVPLRVRPRVPHAPQAHPRPSPKAQQQPCCSAPAAGWCPCAFDRVSPMRPKHIHAHRQRPSSSTGPVSAFLFVILCCFLGVKQLQHCPTTCCVEALMRSRHLVT